MAVMAVMDTHRIQNTECVPNFSGRSETLD